MLKKIFVSLCVSLMMISCEKNKTDVCETTDYFVAKIHRQDFLPIVECSLNGKKGFFILDTGASVTILDSRVAKQYGFYVDKFDSQPLTGFGGRESEIRNAYNTTLILNQTILPKKCVAQDLSHVADAIQHNAGVQVIGVIGVDNMKALGLKIDLKNQILTTWKN